MKHSMEVILMKIVSTGEAPKEQKYSAVTRSAISISFIYIRRTSIHVEYAMLFNQGMPVDLFGTRQSILVYYNWWLYNFTTTLKCLEVLNGS